MAKTGRYLHNPSTSDVVVGVGTAYNAGKKHTIDMKSIRPNGNKNIAFRGFLESLIVGAENIAGGAAKLTLRLTADDGGDFSLVGDVEVELDLGITDPTAGTSQVYYDAFPFENVGDDNIYIFYKVDAGSADISFAQLSWSE
jgi:hypothetical protein